MGEKRRPLSVKGGFMVLYIKRFKTASDGFKIKRDKLRAKSILNIA
jgi:hypothetical protein